MKWIKLSEDFEFGFSGFLAFIGGLMIFMSPFTYKENNSILGTFIFLIMGTFLLFTPIIKDKIEKLLEKKE